MLDRELIKCVETLCLTYEPLYTTYIPVPLPSLQLYEDAAELQMFFVKQRDLLCRNGERLLTPALSITDGILEKEIEIERKEKQAREKEEDKKKSDSEDPTDKQVTCMSHFRSAG